MENKHTPIPWGIFDGNKVIGNPQGSYYIIADIKNPTPVGDGATIEANAAFIVEAVNNHDRLLAEVERLKAELANEREEVTACHKRI
jgi:hypothetical protein